MRFDPIEIDIDASVASTTGSAISFQNMYGFSVVCQSLAAQTGTLKFQGSNSSASAINGNGAAPVWGDIASASITLAGAAIQVLNLDAQYWVWIRAVYTRTGGAGTIVVQLNSKGS